MKPQLLNLVEAFDYDDNSLNTVIGNYDGQYVDRFFNQAQASHLNDKDVLDGFKEHIMPIMKDARL